MTVFVQGWILGNILGEGAYGEVRLVVNESSGEKVAMKIIDLVKHPDARESVKKETTIHRMLKNPNIIQYFGQRSEKTTEYIFLEYACGGELFDKIEPDVGMTMEEAQKYFQQLLSAVEYLHATGIAHRDLKPENLLLDVNDNLKVTDFGLATVFRLKGKERVLDKRCGTLPYVAPEVLERPYHAEPADVWSCGIILVAMLTGELPWDAASKNCLEYIAWKAGNHQSYTPWKKLDKRSLKFIQSILKHTPSERLTVPEIKNNIWCSMKTRTSQESSNTFEENSLANLIEQPIGLSQPVMRSSAMESISNMNLDNRTGLSFSQPMKAEDLFVSSQYNCTQASQSPFQNLVRRMTRFFSSSSCEETVKIVTEFLKKHNYQYHLNDIGTITISTVDKRKMPLVFKINIMDMDENTMIDFRLSKGCGLEFKKEFIKIKKLLKNIL